METHDRHPPSVRAIFTNTVLRIARRLTTLSVLFVVFVGPFAALRVAVWAGLINSETGFMPGVLLSWASPLWLTAAVVHVVASRASNTPNGWLASARLALEGGLWVAGTMVLEVLVMVIVLVVTLALVYLPPLAGGTDWAQLGDHAPVASAVAYLTAGLLWLTIPLVLVNSREPWDAMRESARLMVSCWQLPVAAALCALLTQLIAAVVAQLAESFGPPLLLPIVEAALPAVLFSANAAVATVACHHATRSDARE